MARNSNSCVPSRICRTCTKVRTCASFMSITIPRMIDAPRRRAAHQPLNRLSQPPSGSHLVGIVAPSQGSYLGGQDFQLTANPGIP